MSQREALHKPHLSQSARREIKSLRGLLTGRRSQLMAAGQQTTGNYSLLAVNGTLTIAVASLGKLRDQYEALAKELGAEQVDTAAGRRARHLCIAALSAYIACITELEKAAPLGGSPQAVEAIKTAGHHLAEGRTRAAAAANALDSKWPL